VRNSVASPDSPEELRLLGMKRSPEELRLLGGADTLTKDSVLSTFGTCPRLMFERCARQRSGRGGNFGKRIQVGVPRMQPGSKASNIYLILQSERLSPQA
jgi:hypothetical protein